MMHTTITPFHCGGYLPLGLADIPPCPDSVWALWTDGRSAVSFRNGRSGLAWLLRTQSCHRVWLPGYTCDVVAAGARGGEAAIRYYPAGSTLEPDSRFLGEARSGDAVVVNSYFGRPILDELARGLAARPDLLRIEDRAQALAPGVPTVADWVLYSPRKLLGVSDGGVVVPSDPEAAPVQPDFVLADPAEPARLHEYTLLRLEDPQRRADQYVAYQRVEAVMHVSDTPMTRLTRMVLERTPAAPVMAARRRNWAALYEELGEGCLWDEPAPTWTPLGFPLVTGDGRRLASALAARGVYCPRHWPTIPAPETDAFTADHALSLRLVTVPCDQRYGVDDMRRAATLVRETARACGVKITGPCGR